MLQQFGALMYPNNFIYIHEQWFQNLVIYGSFSPHG